MKDKSRSEQKFIDAIKLLKENNPLARTYLTLYESNAILDKIEEMNKLDKDKYKNDYYIVEEIDIDRKMHTLHDSWQARMKVCNLKGNSSNIKR